MSRFAIVTADDQDVRDVLAELAPESVECLRGYEQDPAKWEGIVETLRLDSDGAYAVHVDGRAVCVFGGILAARNTVEAWLFYRAEMAELPGITKAIKAVADAEFARASRGNPAVVYRALSCLTFPESHIWMGMLGFKETGRRLVLPTGRVAFIYERQTPMALESAA